MAALLGASGEPSPMVAGVSRTFRCTKATAITLPCGHPPVGDPVRQVHIMRHLGEAARQVRNAKYVRLTGKDRHFIKGQKCILM